MKVNSKKVKVLLPVFAFIIIAVLAVVVIKVKAQDQKTESTNENKTEYTLKLGIYYIEGYQEPADWEDGNIRHSGFSIDEYGNMNAGWSMLSSQLIFGQYAIEDGVLSLQDSESGDCYKFKIIADDKVAVMLNESSPYRVYGDEYIIQDGDIFTFAEECPPIVTDENGNPVSK